MGRTPWTARYSSSYLYLTLELSQSPIQLDMKMINIIVRSCSFSVCDESLILCGTVWVGGVSAFVGLTVIYIWGWLSLMVVLLYSYWSESHCRVDIARR